VGKVNFILLNEWQE